MECFLSFRCGISILYFFIAYIHMHCFLIFWCGITIYRYIHMNYFLIFWCGIIILHFIIFFIANIYMNCFLIFQCRITIYSLHPYRISLRYGISILYFTFLFSSLYPHGLFLNFSKNSQKPHHFIPFVGLNFVQSNKINTTFIIFFLLMNHTKNNHIFPSSNMWEKK